MPRLPSLAGRTVLLLGFVLLSSGGDNLAEDRSLPPHFARCTSTNKVVCEGGECKSTPPTVFVLLGEKRGTNTYSRCDESGCDTYDAVAARSGLYENWQLAEPQGVLFKRELKKRSQFVEVATMGLHVYVSSGHCEDAGS